MTKTMSYREVRSLTPDERDIILNRFSELMDEKKRAYQSK